MSILSLQEAHSKITEIVRNKLKDKEYKGDEHTDLVKSIANDTKAALRDMGRDKRYLVQVSLGENKGQGVQVGMRCFWDKETDDYTVVQFKNETIFCMVVAFAVI